MSERASTASAALHLLGRHVARRAEHRAGVGQRRQAMTAGHARDPEVEHLHARRAVDGLAEEEVRGLQITMNDPERVRLGERLTCLHDTLDCELHGQRPTTREHRRQVAPVEALHHEVGHAPARQLADVVHARHVLAPDARDRASLALQANDVLGQEERLGREDLDRDLLLQREVCRTVDDAHAAATEDRVDPVLVGDDVPGDGHRSPRRECRRLPFVLALHRRASWRSVRGACPGGAAQAGTGPRTRQKPGVARAHFAGRTATRPLRPGLT